MCINLYDSLFAYLASGACCSCHSTDALNQQCQVNGFDPMKHTNVYFEYAWIKAPAKSMNLKCVLCMCGVFPFMLARGRVCDCQQAIQWVVRVREADWHGDVL